MVLNKKNKYSNISLLIGCLKHIGRIHEQDFVLDRFDQIFYPIKAIFCILLRRQVGVSFSSMSYPDMVEIYFIEGGSGFDGEYSYHWFSLLEVGMGVFKNWCFTVHYDQDI